MKPKTVHVGSIPIGLEHPFTLIAGPDLIESEEHLISHAERIAEICAQAGVGYIVKCSYYKANRTSGKSYRGPGIEKGLDILAAVKSKLGLPVLSDVHCSEEVEQAAKVLDVIQIPAFLCRQTDFIQTAAKSGKPLHIKKGQFLAPWDMQHVVKKAEDAGNTQLLLVERGATFGYNNLVSDMRSLPIMAETGYPVIFDGTHSVQLPGGQGESSGGQREFVPILTRAAAATGACSGFFMEIHDDPDNAPCDGPNMLNLADLPKLLKELTAIKAAIA